MEIIVADISIFEMEASYDRIFSIEMFEVLFFFIFFSFFYCYFHYLKLCHRLDLAFIVEMVQELVLPFDTAYEEL